MQQQWQLGCMLLFRGSFLFGTKGKVIQEVRELLSNSFFLTVIPVMKEPYIGTRKESKKEQKVITVNNNLKINPTSAVVTCSNE